ncbi:DUF3971 domain-containing protein [Mesobacterium sp. TK19101]|uniref:DUF3971 domain-containing protein n=1 Tax=Mesobacterium hydrothermale TaxID=3111907 RepID=A0ABU6HIT6_9RHOB|nr:DUF3971 domain-containing protein [Mesobacterium sp. TK19101]MEC3862297.1 DUF3971 domain-containing protein [Mesobacterium sp. TK19101]
MATQDDPKKPAPRRRGRRLRRTGLWALLSVSVLVVAVGVVAMTAMGQALSAPPWLKEEITARLDRSLPGLRLTFGDMAVRLEPDATAHVLLRDVELVRDDGARVVALSDVEAAMAPLAMLKGQTGLRGVHLSGAFVTLRRDQYGRVGLAFGDALAREGEMPTIPELVALFDTALANPSLAGLTAIDADGLTLRYEDARARRGWTVDGGRLQLMRGTDSVSLRADFAVLSGGGSAATIEVNAESEIGRNDLVFGMNVQDVASDDIALQSPALAWLGALRAPISGALRAQMFDDGTLGPLNATLQIGAGVLQPNDGTRPIPFTGARTYFTYRPKTARLTFSEISVDSAWGSVVATGQASLQDMQSGLPQRMVGQVQLTDISANPDDVFETPVSIARAEMDFRLDLRPFEFTLGRLRLDDGQLPLFLTGRLAALDAGWQLAIDGHLARAEPDQIAALWPPSLKPQTRNWFTQNVLSGELRDGQIALRVDPGSAPKLYADFEVHGADLRYSPKLPELRAADGQVTIYDNRLVAMVEAGHIEPPLGGQIDVAGSTFVIPDIRIKDAPASLALIAAGPVEAGLAYIDSDPLNVLSRAGLPVALAQGQARVTGTVDLPLKNRLLTEDVDFKLSGTVRNVATDVLIKGRSLRAPSLQLAATTAQVQIAGRGTLDGVPFDCSWTQPLGRKGADSRVTARVELSDKAARAFGLGLPAGMLRGAAQGDLILEIGRNRPIEFRLTSALAGLGASVPQIGWNFGQSATGALDVAGRLTQPVTIDRLSIDAGGLRGDGSISLRADGGLDMLSFADLRLGDWLRAPVTLTGRGANAAPAVAITGGSIDLRRAPFATGSAGGGGAAAAAAAGPVTLALDRMQVSEGIALNRFRGTFSLSGGMQGTFTANVNGNTAIQGDVVPMSGRSAFRIRSDNAGRLMQSVGLLKTAQGGDLTLILTPKGGEGAYDGTFTAANVRLRNAPAIGALLDAISIVGLLDQLEGPGIYFAEVEGEFRLSPQQVILKRSSASGPSMGVSLDGYYDLASGRMDMQGVLSPIYMLNGIGAIFTRKGEGLVGFNFNIKGTAEKPRVSVNPLSILTPGMFREIFRRPPPQLTE